MRHALRLLVVMALCCAPVAAWAQAGVTTYQSPWGQIGQTSLNVSSTSSNVAIPGLPPPIGGAYMVCSRNTGSVDAFVVLGANSSLTATTSGNTAVPVPAGQGTVCLPLSNNTYLAAITASTTTTLVITVGVGTPYSGVPGGGGGTIPQPPAGARSLPATVQLFLYGDSVLAFADSSNVGSYNSGTGLITPAGCTTGGYVCNSYLNQSYGTWISLLTSNRVVRVPNTNNFAASSDVLSDMLPAPNSNVNQRFPNLATAIKAVNGPVTVVYEGGGNDIAAGVNCATVVGYDRQIIQGLLALGAAVVHPTIYPRASPVAFTTTQLEVVRCVNERLRQTPGLPGYGGLYVVDLDGIMSDPTSTSYVTQASSTCGAVLDPDGAHPSGCGGYLAGQAIAAQINQLYPGWLNPPQNGGDVYDSTNNVTGMMLPVSVMTGSSGTVTGTGCSGVAPNSFTLQCSGNSVLAVGSEGTNSDGSINEIITLSGTATGNGIIYLAISNSCCNLPVGTTVEGSMWLNIGSNTGIASLQVEVVNSGDPSSAVTQATGSNSYGSTTSAIPSTGWTGMLPFQTPHYTFQSSNPNGQQLQLRINYLSGDVISGTVTVRSAEYRPVLN